MASGRSQGAHVVIIGAGPAGCLLACALIDGARARRRPLSVTLLDGGSARGRRPSAFLLDERAVRALLGAGVSPPVTPLDRLETVRSICGRIAIEGPAALCVARRADGSELALDERLRAAATGRGVRLLPRAADELLATPGGGWVVRAAGASERADAVVLAAGAGACVPRRIRGDRPAPLGWSCEAALELGAAARAELGRSLVRIAPRGRRPELWVVPTDRGATVLCLHPSATVDALAGALVAAVADGRFPAAFRLLEVRRRPWPIGIGQPALPTLGAALGLPPGPPGSAFGRVAEQALRLAAAFLDGGGEGLLAASRREAARLLDEQRERRDLEAAWRRRPRRLVETALAREQREPPERRPLQHALLALARPDVSPREALRSVRRLSALVSLLLASAAALRSRAATAPRRPASGAAIFVVEDDPDQAAALAAWLAERGLPCRRFGDGLSAAAAAARSPPAAIVLDAALPWLDGLSTCRLLRAQPCTARVPIVLASALPPGWLRRTSADAGADAHFPKPVDLAALFRALEPHASVARPGRARTRPRRRTALAGR